VTEWLRGFAPSEKQYPAFQASKNDDQEETMSRLRLLPVLICVWFFVSGPATAQRAASIIHGNVADENGAALVNVTVTATHIGTDAEYRAVTDADGNYIIRGAQPGEYKLSFDLPGFRKAEREGVHVEGGRQMRVGQARVDVDMEVETDADRQARELTESISAQSEANRREGRRLSKGAIVDSHIHLWDLPRSGPVKANATGDLQATTLQDRSLFPEDCCGAIAPFWNYDFLISHYNQTPGGQKTSKIVLVEALPGVHSGGTDVDKQVEGNQWMPKSSASSVCWMSLCRHRYSMPPSTN
jgi:protocatechuate 3,4-dioxygenase beta subunit